MGLAVTTPATIGPVTVAEAKEHMRIDHDDDDAYIAALIGAAREFLESVCGRTFGSTTYTMTLDAFPLNDYIDFPQPPLQSVTSVTYYDSANTVQTLSSASYDLDTATEPGRIYIDRSTGWPSTYYRRNAVTVVYIGGYGDAESSVPTNIKQAALLLIAEWYENREQSIVGVSYTPTQQLKWLIDNLKVRKECSLYASGILET